MKRSGLVFFLALSLAVCGSAYAQGHSMAAAVTTAGQIRGDYVELRTADVYTGPCFANGEVRFPGPPTANSESSYSLVRRTPKLR